MLRGKNIGVPLSVEEYNYLCSNFDSVVNGKFWGIDSKIYADRIDKNKVQVRFLPVEKILQNADGFSFVTSAPVRVIRIYDSKVYNEFFAQVEQNMRI